MEINLDWKTSRDRLCGRDRIYLTKKGKCIFDPRLDNLVGRTFSLN